MIDSRIPATSGGIANLSIDATIWAFASESVMDSAKFVRVKPGEMTVTRRTLLPPLVHVPASSESAAPLRAVLELLRLETEAASNYDLSKALEISGLMSAGSFSTE